MATKSSKVRCYKFNRVKAHSVCALRTWYHGTRKVTHSVCYVCEGDMVRSGMVLNNS